MADMFNILSSNYLNAGLNVSSSHSKYVSVDPSSYEGTWRGKYANNEKFEVSISNVSGFRARVKYQSGPTVKYQDVLIKDKAFRIGDSKFTLTRAGVAQVKTVVTSPADGSRVLNTAYAKQGT
jgi:hypothetical protein